jgi:predicted metalloprotease with PDZ domain
VKPASRAPRRLAARALSAALPLALSAVFPLALGCAPAASPQCPELPRAPSAQASASASPSASPVSAPASGPRLSIALTPAAGGASLEVSVVASGEPAALQRWSIAAPDPGAIHIVELRDDRGPISAALVDAPARPGAVSPRAFTLAAPPAGALHLRYTVTPKVRPLSAPASVDLDPNRMEAAGEALLLLPDAFDDRPVDCALALNAAELEDNLGAASSAGVGSARERRLRGSELRASTFLFGPMGHALFETAEGHDEAAWFGYTSFDPRPIAADVAAFRTAVGNLFGARATEPSTLLIVADARPLGAFQARRRAGSVLVHVGVAEPWSGPVRISVAAEVIHAWIGERLWIGPDDPAHAAEAHWFSEGVTRHLARDLLFRFGLITADELLDELHGLHGLLATSPRKGESNASLAQHAGEPGVGPLLVARGALYATRVDALLHAKSGGKKGLPELLRALYEQARVKQAALPTRAWVDTIAAELGEGEAASFAKLIEQGQPIELPEGALGPCFRAGKRRYQAFDLGFDEEATRLSASRVVVGLRAGGPAERAGVKEGDRIVDTVQKRGRSEVPVVLSVERGGEKTTLRYSPVGAAGQGQGWTRKRDVPDEACTR